MSIIGLLDPLGLSNAIRADTDWNGVVWELYGFIALVFFIFCFGDVPLLHVPRAQAPHRSLIRNATHV